MLRMDSTKEQPPKDLFDVIGNYGPWQRNVFIIFFCLNCVGMWHNFAITFLAPNLEYKCVTSSNISSSRHAVNLTEKYLPFNDFIMLNNITNVTEDRCSINVTTNPDDGKNSSESLVIPCDKWEYELTFYSRTIVDEWDLVCDKEWLVSLAKSIYMVGFMISVLVFGQISDCIGRWPTVLICYVITCVSGLMSAFSTSYPMFLVLRFFQAFGRTGLTTTGFVLITEISGPKYRTNVGIAIQAGWAAGFITLPAVAWFIRNWVWFQLITTFPIIPFFFMYWIVPESPRWLMTQGKMEKFEKVVKKAAKLNGKLEKSSTVNLKTLMPTLKLGAEEKTQTGTLLDLFKTPRLRSRTLNCIYHWMVNAFMYYGLSYNTNDLGGDPYLNFFIAGVLELPSYLVVFYAISRYGRRIVYIICMLVGGIACAAIMAVPESMPYLATAFAMVGKFCITGSFGILYLYCSELFPTVVRNVAIGSCSTCARVGSIIAPFVRELGKATHPSVPNAIYACLAITSGVLARFLPETNNKKIADTLEEGERFGRNGDNDDEVENPSKTMNSHVLRCGNIFSLKFFRSGITKTQQ